MTFETTANARLYQWVRDNGIRVDEMAEKIGRRPVYLMAVLLGQHPLTDSLIGAFARAYGTRAAQEAFGLTEEVAAK